MPSSSIAPESCSIRTTASYSSADSKCGGGPALGQRCQRTLRQLAYPVSVLRYTAEFAVSASSSGSHGRSRLLTWIAASRSGTATCTWQPQMPCSWAIMPNLLRDLAVARGVGDRELVRHASAAARRRAVARRRPRRPRRRCGAAGSARSRSSSLLFDDLGRRLDLAAGQLELQLDAALGGVAGDRLVAGDRFAGVGSTSRNSSSTPTVGWLAMVLEILIRPVGDLTTGRIAAVSLSVVDARGVEVWRIRIARLVGGRQTFAIGCLPSGDGQGLPVRCRLCGRASRCRRFRTRRVEPRTSASTCCTCPTTSGRPRRSRR